MSNRPEFTIRDGSVKATTWRNAGENGDYFTTSFSRTFRDEKSGDLRDTNAFSGADLLKISALAQEAYQQSRELRNQERLGTARSGKDQERRLEEARHSKSRRRNRDQLER